ncbi:MAG: uroporphyrinogen decarboxylase family protein [Nitrospinota bacterium]
MSSRQLARSFLRGAPCPRPPLIPLAFYHASRLDAFPVEVLVRDPTRLTQALIDQWHLLGVDCVVVRIDAGVLAELAGIPVTWSPTGPTVQWDAAGGCPWPPDALQRPPVTALVEVIRRLRIQLQKQVLVLAVLPGPVGLCRQVCPNPQERLEETVSLLRNLAEEACRAGAEAVMLEETGEERDGEQIAAAAEPICNTVRYYNAFSVLYASAPPTRKVADALLFHPHVKLNCVPPEIPAGIFVPPASFDSPEGLADFVLELESTRRPVFLTTGDDTLLSHPIETNAALFASLRQVQWE